MGSDPKQIGDFDPETHKPTLEPTCPPPPPRKCEKHGVMLMPHWTGALEKKLPRLVAKKGGPRWVHETCQKCDDERLQEEIRKSTGRSSIKQTSPFGPKFEKATFDSFECTIPLQRKVLQHVQEFIQKAVDGKRVNPREQHILFLCGPCGTGKTHLCESAWKMMDQNNRRVIGFERNEILRQMKSHLSIDDTMTISKYTNQICTMPLLILDDFRPRMFDKQSSADQDMVHELFNGIYKNLTRVLVTSNLNEKEFCNSLGTSAASRFLEMRKVLKCTWDSQRPLNIGG